MRSSRAVRQFHRQELTSSVAYEASGQRGEGRTVMRAVTLLVLLLLLSPQLDAGQATSVTGVVQDQTGALLPGATVDQVVGGRVVQSVVTDGVGAFHFDRRRCGDLRASHPRQC